MRSNPDYPGTGCQVGCLIMIIVIAALLFILCSCKTLYDTNRIVIVKSFDGELYHSILRDAPDSVLFRTSDILELNQTYLIGENFNMDIKCIPVEDNYTFSGNSNVIPISELLKHK